MKRLTVRTIKKCCLRAGISLVLFFAAVLTVSSGKSPAVMGSPCVVHAAEEMTATGKVINDKLNVRTGPSTSDDVLGQLAEGDTVDITGTDGDWYRIEYDEEVGYVASKYVEIIEGDGAAEDGDDVSDEADTEDDLEDKDSEEDSGDEEGAKAADFDPSFALVIGAVILLLVVIIFATVKSIRNMSEDDYTEYDDGYGDDDDYEEDYGDEYADDYEDDREDDYAEDDYEDDPPVEDEYPEDAYEEPDREEYDDTLYDEDRRVRKVDLYPEEMARDRAVRAIREGADPVQFMSNNPDDYRIDIDPSFFEKTGVLPGLDDLTDDADAPEPIGPVPDGTPGTTEGKTEGGPDVKEDNLDREAKLDEALKKMEELKAEIEKIKNEQT